MHITAMAVDERVETALAQPVGQALTVHHGLDVAVSRARRDRRAGDPDHLRAALPGELVTMKPTPPTGPTPPFRVEDFEYGTHRSA